MSEDAVDGGCLCGAIRYRATAPPSARSFCHCRTCRKAAASPVVAWVTFHPEAFAFVSGAPLEFRSSAKVIRTFCGTCGTPLTYTHADYPSSIDVTTCSLDAPEAFEPQEHGFLSERVRWLHVNEDLPVSRRFP